MIVVSKANSILSDIFSKNNWLKLSTTTPTATGGNFTEPPTSCGYRAKQLSEMGSPSNGQVENDDIIFIGEIVSDGGTVTHFGIFTSSTASTPIYVGTLSTPKVLEAGKALLIRKDAMKIAIDKSAFD